MIKRFTTGCSAIVTTYTGTNDITVVYCISSHWRPWRRARLMAGITGIGGVDMVHTLATGRRAIVTTETGTDNLGMVYRSTGYR